MKAIVKATAKCKGGFKGYFVKNVPGICSDEIHEEIPVFGTREEANPIEFDPKTENLYELCNVNPEMTELTIEFDEPKTQLTANEQEVLKALVLNAQAEGDSGTEFLIDEVAAALNKSEKSVAATVGELQKKGLVDCYAKGYYFNGAVTEKGMAEFDKIEKTTKKETIERNLKTAKEFQDAIKDCTSEAAQEYKNQAQATIEHYQFELAKLARPNYDGLKKYLEKINVAFEEIGEDIKVTSSQHGMYFIPKNFPDQVMKFGYGFEPTGRDKNGYCYVILTPNPVEEESKPEAPQTEVGNEPEKKVAKSKHQIGDTKFYLGITYYVAGFNAKGTPLWRVKKDTESAKA